MLERVARPPPAPSLNRLLGEGLDGSFKRSRSIRGCSHRLGRRNNPQQGSSSRLCRDHSALVQRGRSGEAAATPEHTEWYGRCWRAEKSCTSREAACAPLLLSRAVAASLCASPPPTVLERSRAIVHASRYRAVRGSVPRGRPPAVPRGRPRGKRTIRESIPRGIEFPLSVYRGSLWTREGHVTLTRRLPTG